MGPRPGTDVWRSLMGSLRSIARKPIGTVKPTCSGCRADSQELYGTITWEGDPPARPTGFMCEHLPDFPANSIDSSFQDFLY